MAEEFKTGVLIKKSRNRGAMNLFDNWQERKITLLRDMVTYGPLDGPTKDHVPINMSTVVEPTDITKDMGKSFRIVTGTDELILCCPDENIRDQWITAIKTIAHDPTPDDHSDDAARLAGNMDKLKVEQEAKRKAEEEAAKLAAQALETDAARKIREAAEAAAKKAAAEAEAKKKMIASLQKPQVCQKKLSTESSYHERYIWVDPNAKEFHWAKNAEDMTKSKCINITKHIKSIKANTLPDVLEPNFTIELEDAASLPDTVFATKLFSSALPTSIDITMADAAKNAGFVAYINDIKNPPPATPAVPAGAAGALAGAAAGALAGAAAGAVAGSMGVPTSSSSAMRMAGNAAGVPTSATSAMNKVL